MTDTEDMENALMKEILDWYIRTDSKIMNSQEELYKAYWEETLGLVDDSDSIKVVEFDDNHEPIDDWDYYDKHPV